MIPFVLSALVLAAGIHHAGKCVRHGRPLDAMLAAAWFMLAALFFLHGINRSYP